MLRNLLEQSKNMYISPSLRAFVHFSLGENDQGFALLEKAYDDRDYFLRYLKVHPVFDSIRPDPRYAAMLKKMNLKP